MQARSQVTLERIYEAAGQLVIDHGVGSLTMDAVAATAGISKGGLLHHFRSKESLVTALLLRKLQELRDGLTRKTVDLPGPARTLQGMIAYGAEQYGARDSFPRALLVAAVETSHSLEAFQQMFRALLADIRDEAGTEAQRAQADVLFFATIGLLMSHSLGVAELDGERRNAVFGCLTSAAATPTPPDPHRDTTGARDLSTATRGSMAKTQPVKDSARDDTPPHGAGPRGGRPHPR